MNVYILSGIPGSGKSTWALAHLPGAEVVSADQYFGNPYRFDPRCLPAAHDACFHTFQYLIYRGAPEIVVDNTNLEWRHVERYVTLAKSAGYTVNVVRFSVPVEVASRRNVHGVPQGTIKRMAALKLEVPDWVVQRSVT
jgi:predicted kinase